MGQKIIILENIRSAYNVGNVVRTADALGRNVWITGYTPSPIDHPKVRKTSLGAENHVGLKQFDYTSDAIKYAKEHNITNEAKPLDTYTPENNNLAIIFGNEVEGVLPQTLQTVDEVVYIPMQGIKESMNIGQSTAIMMRALRN